MNRRKGCFLCVKPVNLFFSLNLSVVTVQLLRVPVVMRNCCEMHPPAPNEMPKCYICNFDRLSVFKSELAALQQAVPVVCGEKQAPSGGESFLPSQDDLITLCRYLLLSVASKRSPGWLNHSWTSNVQASVWGWIITHFLKLLQLTKRAFKYCHSDLFMNHRTRLPTHSELLFDSRVSTGVWSIWIL